MNLTNADKERIAAWVGEKCGQIRCVCCGHGQWTVLDISTLAIGHDLHTTRFHYHAGLPQVAIVCNSCGHMVLFNPAVMGFRPDEPAVAEIAEEGESEGE